MNGHTQIQATPNNDAVKQRQLGCINALPKPPLLGNAVMAIKFLST